MEMRVIAPAAGARYLATRAIATAAICMCTCGARLQGCVLPRGGTLVPAHAYARTCVCIISLIGENSNQGKLVVGPGSGSDG